MHLERRRAPALAAGGQEHSEHAPQTVDELAAYFGPSYADNVYKG
jgi:hypothetical protein